MAVIVDYTTLSSAVESYLDRSDLSTFTPNFIESAERLVYRAVRHRGLETEFTATTSSGAVALSGLTNFRNIKWIRTSATGGQFLEPMSVEALYRAYPDRTVTATFPKFYARDGANLIFGPAAAESVALDGVYYKLLPVLSASNTTNWFTTNAPEVLLYGALMQAEPFMVGDQRVPVWASLFKAHFEAIQDEGKLENRTGSTRRVKVV